MSSSYGIETPMYEFTIWDFITTPEVVIVMMGIVTLNYILYRLLMDEQVIDFNPPP